MKPNPEQTKAIEHFVGPCLITATPGSGKTSVITSRVLKLIEQNVDPKNILCVTFTNKAANEMRERINILGGEKTSNVWISTFHSLFLTILRKYATKVGLNSNFSILDQDEQLDIVSKICRMEGNPLDKIAHQIILKISNDSREGLLDLDDIKVDVYYKIVVKEYLKYIDSINAIDFSGILYKAYLLLNDNNICQKISDKFKFVLCDEWQDTNKIQYECIKKIASHSNLFVVGDFQQSIFAFRGSRPENIHLIKKDFENVNEIVLPRNYRSTKQILISAEKLINNNSTAGSVQLISEVGEGNRIESLTFQNPEFEASWIGSTIKQFHEHSNYKWSDFAILYRMNNLSKIPEIVLRNLGIPYKIYGGFSFFNRKEIKTSIAYLRLLANPKDTIAFSRAIQEPSRSVGEVLVGKIERICQEQNMDVFSVIKDERFSSILHKNKKSSESLLTFAKIYGSLQATKPLTELSVSVLKETGFYDALKKESEKDIDSKKRIDNVDELLISISDFAKQRPDVELSDYLQSIELISSHLEDEDDNRVSLLTMHSAKGLEFKCVFVIGAEQGIIPHKRALIDGEIEEERRLMYVAVTRAKEQLFISNSEYRKRFDIKAKDQKNSKCLPSQFIKEMELDV